MNVRQRLLTTATLLGALAACNGYKSPTAPTQQPPVSVRDAMTINTPYGTVLFTSERSFIEQKRGEIEGAVNSGVHEGYHVASVWSYFSERNLTPRLNLEGVTLDVYFNDGRDTQEYTANNNTIRCSDLESRGTSSIEGCLAVQVVHLIAHQAGKPCWTDILHELRNNEGRVTFRDYNCRETILSETSTPFGDSFGFESDHTTAYNGWDRCLTDNHN